MKRDHEKLVRMFKDGKTYAEIATETGMSISSVGTFFYWARLKGLPITKRTRGAEFDLKKMTAILKEK